MTTATPPRRRCDDLCVAMFCKQCVTFQIGNHLFDYTNNPEVSIEAVPTHFVV